MNMKLAGCALLAATTMGMGVEAMGEAVGPPWLLVATGDFGANSTDGTPDGCTDLLWWNKKTGSMMIHYINEDGVTVKNVIGSIDRVDVLAGGSDYFSNDSLRVDSVGTGGIGFEGQLEITAPIFEINVLEPGRDYIAGTIEETVPGTAGGSGCIAITTVADGGAASGELADFEITSAGVGYYPSYCYDENCRLLRNGAGEILDGRDDSVVVFPVPLDTVLTSFPPNGGAPAIVTVFVNEDGQVVSSLLATGGSAYIETPDLQFIPPLTCSGSGFTFQPYLFGGIKSVTVAVPGSGYAETPEWTPPGRDGIGAELETVRGPGSITGVEIVDAGRNYVVAPLLSIDSDLGAGANFDFVVNSRGPQTLRSPAGTPVDFIPYHRWFETKVGDFDGDGDADIMFHRRDRCYFWFMENGAVADTGLVDELVGSSWRARAVGDFDADGDDDVLFWNRVSGQTNWWFLDYTPGQPDQWISYSYGERNSDTKWQPFGANDVLPQSPGDELLWGNVGTGSLAIVAISEDLPPVTERILPVRDTSGAVLAAGRKWEPIGWGDLNSNNAETDVFMRHRDGDASAIWQLDAATVYDRNNLTTTIGDAITRYTGVDSVKFDPVGLGEYVIVNEDDGSTVRHAHIFWQQKDNRRAVNWRVDRGLRSALTNIGYNGVDIGRIAEPFFIDGAFLMAADGVVSQLVFEEPPEDDSESSSSSSGSDSSSGSGSGSGSGGSGGSGYDINSFDARDQSTWPDGIETAEEMWQWLGANLVDPSTWPDGIDTESEFTTWLLEQGALLGVI